MSLQGTEYETIDEVQFRLADTVVKYDDEPVYISQVSHNEDLKKGEIFRVHIIKLPLRDGLEERKFISSGKFNLSPFPMGFLNWKEDCFYLTRSTIRQNKQGLNSRTLTVSCLKEKGPIKKLSFGEIIRDASFVDMIKGIYPVMEEAVSSILAGKKTSVAISREYALRISPNIENLVILFHKLDFVGFMEISTKQFIVGNKFKFLKEELEERHISFKLV